MCRDNARNVENYEGKEIHVLQEFRLLSSEVTSRIAFGNSYIEGKNIFEMLTKLGFIIYKIFLTIRVPVISKFFKTSDEIESEKLEKGIQDSIIEIIKKKRREGNGQRRRQIWNPYRLQEEARKEVIQLFGKETPHSDGIAKLKTMSMIINESLWLYPPLVSIIRKVEREVRLEKLTLPPNLDLVISTIAIHHDPEIWGEDVHLSNQRDFWKGLLKQLTTT
ncbi:hypothetical protein L3X38_041238 [Prunus dulcis]|uniref:Uncharacterized protein n=1 Tax=Prunus dulcis TaxID=3755 RepID=A0AAD4USM1_PRUDU|nr:hypothetical protein L3X38_041238 [Prunus dulcis]